MKIFRFVSMHKKRWPVFILLLKGLSQGHNAIFKGLKMTFRMKILKKKLYHANQHQNTTNFVLTTFLYDHFF